VRIPRSIAFILQSIAAGLAAAIVIAVFFPGVLHRQPVVEFREGASPPAPSIPGQQSQGKDAVSYAGAVAVASPAVINIHTAKLVTERPSPLLRDPFFRRFFGNRPSQPQQRLETSLGSGVILSEQGYILTNNHVVAEADQIQIMLQDGRSARAQIVGTDPDTDLAVLKVELDALPSIAIGHSEELQVGDVVLAIGNPFGVGQTVTMGIISATGRNQLGINTFEDFIQTDAAINPGNSGGALIDPYGHLIGINTAIFSRTGGSEGIGFAIPVSLARHVMEQIIERGYVARGWLGIEVQELTPALADSFQLGSENGVLVARIMAGGPADRAGLAPGDVITRVGGEPVKDAREAINAIAAVVPGHKVSVTIVRRGRTGTVEATVSQRPTVKRPAPP
jgi:serine protease DegS